MTEQKSFDDRRRALEEAFSNVSTSKELREMKAAAEKMTRIAGLKSASGIVDEAVLNDLAGHDITVNTISALALVPLVEMAWCDGELDAREKEAILKAASSLGMPLDGPAHQLLSTWLDKAPPLELLESWEAYTKVLCARFDPSARAKVRKEIMGRARQVAEAAGGFLGLVSKIAPAEQRMLDRLSKAFD